MSDVKNKILYNIGKRPIGYLNLDGVTAVLNVGGSGEMSDDEATKLLRLYANEVSDSKSVEGETVKGLRARVAELEAEIAKLKVKEEVKAPVKDAKK